MLKKMVVSYYCVLSFVLGTVEEIKKYLLFKHKLSNFHILYKKVEGECSKKVQ